MNSSKIVLRINAANPNHHLWNNNGTWWCHYTVHSSDFQKARVRRSLGTSELSEAKLIRDDLLVTGCGEVRRAVEAPVQYR